MNIVLEGSKYCGRYINNYIQVELLFTF